jgi:hypothetical protein
MTDKYVLSHNTKQNPSEGDGNNAKCFSENSRVTKLGGLAFLFGGKGEGKMEKRQTKNLVLAMIAVFMATALFWPGMTPAGNNQSPKEILNSMTIMLDEIYGIVLDTNNKVWEIGVNAPQKTGQDSCWDSSPLGNPINCEGTGQDGELQRGVAWPDPRFTDNGDGTATDNLTGLIWLKNGTCFPEGGPAGATTWQSALDACNNLQNLECRLSDGSSSGDWRLPNVRELHSLIDFGNYHPALPTGHPFTVADTYYWTSTTVADSPSRAFRVSLDAGNVGEGTKLSPDGLVLPVRGGN